MKSRILGLLAATLLAAVTTTAANAITVTDPGFYTDLAAGTSHDLAGFNLAGAVSGPASLSVRYGQWNGTPGVLDIVLTFNGTQLASTQSTDAYYDNPASRTFDVSSLVLSGFNSLSAFATLASGGPVTYALGEISLEYASAMVPEPGTLALLGLGLVGLGFSRRRKSA